MENASKALLIAAGILLTMLIIALLIFARTRISDFYSNEEELKEIDNVTEFNLQFSGYQNREVHGYEIISLANKVEDYNRRHSNAEGATNDEKYNPIVMTVNLPNNENTEKLWYDNTYTPHLFTRGQQLVQSTARADILNSIKIALSTERLYNSAEVASKLAKSINVLILTDAQIQYNQDTRNMTPEESKLAALSTYKTITKDESIKTYDAMVAKVKGTAKIFQYYEYYQFKKAIFECTEISYDDISGRVSTLKFKFTGHIE